MKEDITADLVLEGSLVSQSFFQFMTIANYDAFFSNVSSEFSGGGTKSIQIKTFLQVVTVVLILKGFLFELKMSI